MTEEEKKSSETGVKGAVVALAAIVIMGAAFSYANKNAGVAPEANTATVIASPQQQPSTAAAQHGATEQQPTSPPVQQQNQAPTNNGINIGFVSYDILMGEHPLVKEAQAISEQKVAEAREKTQGLSEIEQIEAWRNFEQETMKDLQENYIDKARHEVDIAIDEVLAQKGISVLFNGNQLLRGGIDITHDVQEVLKKKK